MYALCACVYVCMYCIIALYACMHVLYVCIYLIYVYMYVRMYVYDDHLSSLYMRVPAYDHCSCSILALSNIHSIVSIVVYCSTLLHILLQCVAVRLSAPCLPPYPYRRTDLSVNVR